MKQFHLTAIDLERADMRCIKKPLVNFLKSCNIKELFENKGFDDAKGNFADTVESKMPPKIPLRSKVSHINEEIIISVC
jgi:hypothetical protein